MKTQIAFFCTFFIAISVLFFSCKKDKAEGPPPCNTCPVPSDIFDWFYFKVGTYWIYKEENSGNIDSVFVINAFVNNGAEASDPYLRVTASSSFDGYNYLYKIDYPGLNGCSPIITRNGRCFGVMLEKSKPGDFVGVTTIFFYPVYLNDYLYEWGENITTVNAVFDSLLIDTSYYYNVVKMRRTIDYLNNNQDSYYYYSPKYGMIRKELVDSSEVWNLVRYNVIQ